MRNKSWLGAGAAIIALGVARTAGAFPTEPTVEVNQRGGFLLVGNTQGYDCSLDNSPVVASDVGDVVPPIPFVEGTEHCNVLFESELGRRENAAATDTAVDLFWSQAGGTLTAQPIEPEAAISGAVLTIPDGATVTHAWLYWAGYLATEEASDPVADPSIDVIFPENALKVIGAERTWTQANEGFYWYQAAADVTAAVQTHGSGLHLVSGVESVAESHEANDDVVAAWWLAVVYEHPDANLVNLRLYDGLDVIGANEASDAPPTVSVPLSGLPTRGNAAGRTKLGVIGYEGDAQIGGDYVRVGQTMLADGLNPAENFFNGTRSNLGTAGTDPGDVPYLTGEPRSVAGIDVDVVDISASMAGSGELPTIHAGSSYDRYLLAGLVTQVPVSLPLLEATMSVEPRDGAFEPGTEVRYTVVVENTGNAPATGMVFTDVLPEQLALVADSVQSSGSSSSLDGSQVAYDATTRTLTVHLGDGAGANAGGALAPGASLELRFQATIIQTLPGCTTNPCTVSNQGVIQLAGNTVGTTTAVRTDGEPATPAQDPTTFEVVIGCLSADDCSAALPICDQGACVECLTNSNCSGDTPVCLDATCVGCQANSDCSGDTPVCLDTTCVGCAANSDCSGDTPVCLDTSCVGCADRSDCSGDTPYCANLTCVECRRDTDCTSPAAPNCNPDTKVCECASANGCAIDDTDGDGLSDDKEAELGTDPSDADTDDDGLLDGAEPNPGDDTDGDGLINALDIDSDNDGLLDGTEAGTDCGHADTDPKAKRCVPDADGGETTTDPIKADTDGGGLQDGAEDVNLDGAIDRGETDPNDPSDDTDLEDSDGDGLSDDLETTLRSDPNDADTDDDGVLDGDEPNPGRDDDGDGRTSLTDPDSDNDGLFDGTELGLDCSHPDTDRSAGTCVADADNGETTTSPIDPDTDDGGIPDGSEDFNLNGRIDDGEGDPNDPSDDSSIRDSDGDGLSDGLEEFLGSDPNDADTDDDGVLDGQEANPSQDLDGDGLTAVVDPDSDGDLLWDGVEVGTDCSHPDSDPDICIVDSDAGLTTSSPLWVDTDADGVADGVVDANWDGVIDERDELFLDGEIKGGGCACSAPAHRREPFAGLLLGLAALLLTAARRRR